MNTATEVELVDAFRRLRAAWFAENLHQRSHERQWESDVDTERRKKWNAELRGQYDEQTNAIIRGEDFPVAPRCPNDLLSQLVKEKTE